MTPLSLIKKTITIFLTLTLIMSLASCSRMMQDGSDGREDIRSDSSSSLQCEEQDDSYLIALSDEEAAKLESVTSCLLYEDPEKPGYYINAVTRSYDHPDQPASLSIEKERQVCSVKNPETGTSEVLRSVIRKNENSYFSSNIYLSESMTGVFANLDCIKVGLTLEKEKGKSTDSSFQGLIPSFSQLEEGGINPAAFEHFMEKGQGLYNSYAPKWPALDENNVIEPYDLWPSYETCYYLFRFHSLRTDPVFSLEDLERFDLHFAMQICLSFSDGSTLATKLLDLTEEKKSSEKKEHIEVDTPKGQLDFVIREKEAALTGYRGEDPDLTIPSSIENCKVVSIEDGAISYNNTIESISLPEGLRFLSPDTFSGCSKLSEIRLKKENKDFRLIGGFLISGDGKKLLFAPRNLSGECRIPEGVEEVAPYAFRYCSGIKSVRFPDSLQKIAYRAFWGTCLTEFNFPDSLKSIGPEAFSDTSPLSAYLSMQDERNVKVPEITLHLGRNIEWIGENAFNGYCIKSYRVDRENPFYSSGQRLLFNKDRSFLLAAPCVMHGTLTLPEGLTNMSEGSLSVIGDLDNYTNNPDPVTRLVLPDSLKYFLPAYGFELPSRLESIHTGKNIKEWASPAILHKVRLENPEDLSCFQIIDGVFYSSDKGTLLLYPDSLSQKSFRIPSFVRSIHPDAFNNNKNLEEIIFPEDLVLKDHPCRLSGILSSIRGLEKISVEENNPAFYSIDGLLFDRANRFLLACPGQYSNSTLKIPEGTIGIYENAVYFDMKLDSLMLPSSLKHCRHPLDYGYFFQNLDEIDNITVEKENPYLLIKDGILISKAEGSVLRPIGEQMKEIIVLPGYVKTIPQNCFDMNRWTRKPSAIHFEEGLKTIESGNFNDIDKRDDWDIVDIYLPGSLRKISEDSFKNSPGIRLQVKKGSFAEAFAKQHAINYVNDPD